MAPRTPRKLLPFLGTTVTPSIMDRSFWSEALVTKDRFWAEIEKNTTEVEVQFEQSSSSSGEAAPHNHQVPFLDHTEGEGILIHIKNGPHQVPHEVAPHSILKMKVEKGEVCWSDIDFEAKS